MTIFCHEIILFVSLCSVELPEPPIGLGVSNIQDRSVFLQFQPGFDGKTSITLWIVEAAEGLQATTYKPVFQVSVVECESHMMFIT